MPPRRVFDEDFRTDLRVWRKSFIRTPAYRRVGRTWWLATATIMFAPLVLMFSAPAIRSSPLVPQSLKDAVDLVMSTGMIGWYATVALGCTISVIGQRKQFAMFRAVRKLGPENICTECAYDLTALEPEGTCPECGRSYLKSLNALLWTTHTLPPKPRAFGSKTEQHSAPR